MITVPPPVIADLSTATATCTGAEEKPPPAVMVPVTEPPGQVHDEEPISTVKRVCVDDVMVTLGISVLPSHESLAVFPDAAKF